MHIHSEWPVGLLFYIPRGYSDRSVGLTTPCHAVWVQLSLPFPKYHLVVHMDSCVSVSVWLPVTRHDTSNLLRVGTYFPSIYKERSKLHTAFYFKLQISCKDLYKLREASDVLCCGHVLSWELSLLLPVGSPKLKLRCTVKCDVCLTAKGTHSERWVAHSGEGMRNGLSTER